MKWYTKLFVLLAVGTLLFVIVGMIYLVNAKYRMNDYTVELGLAFNAATYVNATETFTDEENAVIAEFNGKRSVIVPENYKSLQSYLRRDHAMPFLAFVNKDKALHISICGKSHLYIVGDKDGQGALIRFESSGEKFTMHVTGGDLWQKILDVSLKGSYHGENIGLE
ncbi:MAG: hypothetical protein E7331_07340 [Clostridiales bacterium]|nr:hypothetical protein [Clostridiales bacterium]